MNKFDAATVHFFWSSELLDEAHQVEHHNLEYIKIFSWARNVIFTSPFNYLIKKVNINMLQNNIWRLQFAIHCKKQKRKKFCWKK